MTPITLSIKATKKILATIPKDRQGYALVEHLATRPRAHRLELLAVAGPLNLPQAARYMNKYLNPYSLRIGCCEPAVEHPNHLDKRTSAYEWSLCKLTPSELQAPETGISRPRVEDVHKSERRAAIYKLIERGYTLTGAIDKTRKMGVEPLKGVSDV